MRRRLHALYASAQVFREEALASAVKGAIERLDRARDGQRPLASDDLETLEGLAISLPSFGSTQEGKPSLMSTVPPERLSLGAIPLPDLAPVESRKQPLAIPPLPPFTRGARRAKGDSVARVDGIGEARGLSDHRTLVSVLVLDDRATTAQIKESFPAERFEVLATDNPDEALRLARSSAPDLVLADYRVALHPEIDFIARLRADPLTDLVPVFVLIPAGKPYDAAKLRQAGVDHVVFKPVDGWALLRAVGAMLQGPEKHGSALDGLSEATVDEVVDRVTQEIRHGLSESLQSGRERKIPLGEGHEILAAAWSAIGRIRAHLSNRSAGGIRFRDGPRRGGPAVLALVDGDSYPDDGTALPSLDGRRFLVVDDDPGVRWFFAGLLKEAGALVAEASNGQQALEAARQSRPDIVISDILMPGIDGFMLCQEFKRDVILADVPVILISWKEDLLARMRELQAGASGYLRKEAGATQILECVYQVLRPIERLEAQLRTGGEVRGRLDGLGVLTLLKTVGRERPNARVTVRDARSLFEIDFRKSEIAALTKTATDGSFVRGQVALQQLLAARSGRFAVVQSDAPVRGVFREPLAALLQKTANQLAALLDAVSDAQLVRVHKIVLDEEILPSLFSTGPRPPQETKMIERLRRGESPKDMIVDGRVAPRELEACLDDLARTGAIAGVLGPNGEDRVAEALRIREERPGTLFQSTPPEAIPEGGDGDFWNEVDQDSHSGVSQARDPIKDSSSGGSVAEALRAIQAENRSEGSALFEQPAEYKPAIELPERSAKPVAVTTGNKSHLDLQLDGDSKITPSAHGHVIDQLIDSAIGPASKEKPSDEALFRFDSDIPPDPPGQPPTVSSNAVYPGDITPIAKSFGADLAAKLGREVACAETGDTPELLPTRGGMIEQALREELARASAKEGQLSAVQNSNTSDGSPAKTELPQKEPPVIEVTPTFARTGVLVALLAFVTAVAAGYVSVQWLGKPSAGRDDRIRAAQTGKTALSGARLPMVANEPKHSEKTSSEQMPSTPAVQPNPPSASVSDAAVGAPRVPKEESTKRTEAPERALPFIDRSWGVEVPDDQGLLVVAWKGAANAPEVRIDDSKFGRPPLAAALDPGRHELKFSYKDHKSSRRLTVRRGVTRIVYAPE
jgi:CheY-like chemotaxis protein